MILHWPQFTILALTVFGLGLAAARHGMPRSLENFWIRSLIVSINLSLLYAGGFFG